MLLSFVKQLRPRVLGVLFALAFTVAAPAVSSAQAAAPRWPALEGAGSYVFFLAENVAVVNGSPRDYERGQRVRKSPQEALFWFQHGGKEYVLRDAATLKQLQAAFEPQMKLGQQQTALEQKQAELANQQAIFETQISEEVDKQADFGLRMAQLSAEQARLQGQGEDAAEIEAEIEALEQEQEQTEEPQVELARQREAVTHQRDLLSREQEELGRQLEKATQEGEKRLQAIVAKALANGAAKPVVP